MVCASLAVRTLLDRAATYIRVTKQLKLCVAAAFTNLLSGPGLGSTVILIGHKIGLSVGCGEAKMYVCRQTVPVQRHDYR